MNLLTLEDVTVRLEGKSILEDVSTELPAGQIVGIVGPNGSGKTTLLNAIAQHIGFSGRIKWRGQRLRVNELGYIPQNSTIDADLTVLEAVLLGQQRKLGFILDPKQIAAAAHAISALGLSELSSRSMTTLSGGQHQLVLLAQRLQSSPALLMLDESTSALDIRHQIQVFGILREYAVRTGALVLITIHDLNLASRETDSILLLDRGRLVDCGSKEQVLTAEAIRQAYGVEVELFQSKCGNTVIFPTSCR